MIAELDRQYLRTGPFRVMPRLLSYALFEGRPVTTVGRWINPLVFGLFSIGKQLRPLRRVEKPVFIIGTGRSGTTALGVVLSMHRKVGFLNEPKALWHAILPNEDLVGSYSSKPGKYRLDADDATEGAVRNAHRLFGAYLFTSTAYRLVDKYPELVFRVPFVKAIFPDAKFLFLVRNGWDTCRSIDIWSQRKSTLKRGIRHDWWGVGRCKWTLLVDQIARHDPDLSDHLPTLRSLESHPQMAAVEWSLSMREGLEMRARYPQDIYTVRYEALTRQPAKTLPAVLEFCELEPDSRLLTYATRVLRPMPPHEPFELEPAIEAAFIGVLRDLGYARQPTVG